MDAEKQKRLEESEFLSELRCYCQSHLFQPSSSKGSQVCLHANRLRPSMRSASSDQCQSLPECTAPALSPGETENETKGDRTWRQVTWKSRAFPCRRRRCNHQLFPSSINLPIILMIDYLVCEKCSSQFPRVQSVSSDCLFWPTNRPKPLIYYCK